MGVYGGTRQVTRPIDTLNFSSNFFWALFSTASSMLWQLRQHCFGLSSGVHCRRTLPTCSHFTSISLEEQQLILEMHRYNTGRLSVPIIGASLVVTAHAALHTLYSDLFYLCVCTSEWLTCVNGIGQCRCTFILKFTPTCNIRFRRDEIFSPKQFTLWNKIKLFRIRDASRGCLKYLFDWVHLSSVIQVQLVTARASNWAFNSLWC